MNELWFRYEFSWKRNNFFWTKKKEEETFIEWPELNQNKEIEVKYTKYDLCTIG